jgi:hypothetical protein
VTVSVDQLRLRPKRFGIARHYRVCNHDSRGVAALSYVRRNDHGDVIAWSGSSHWSCFLSQSVADLFPLLVSVLRALCFEDTVESIADSAIIKSAPSSYDGLKLIPGNVEAQANQKAKHTDAHFLTTGGLEIGRNSIYKTDRAVTEIKEVHEIVRA